jgi:hypothetical protein
MGDLLPEPPTAVHMKVFHGGGGESEGGARSDLLHIPVERVPLVEFRGGGTVQVGGALADELSGFTFKNVEIFKVPTYDIENYLLVLLEGAWPAQAGGSFDDSVMVGGATPEEARAALEKQKDLVEEAEVADAAAAAAAAAATVAGARAAVLTPLQETKEAAKLITVAAKRRYNVLLREYTAALKAKYDGMGIALLDAAIQRLTADYNQAESDMRNAETVVDNIERLAAAAPAAAPGAGAGAAAAAAAGAGGARGRVRGGRRGGARGRGRVAGGARGGAAAG